jgi:protein subunit release factor A
VVSAVPTAQYRTDYTILIPQAYNANYLSISAAATGAVTVNGNTVALTAFPAGGTHRVARVPVTAGQYNIHCPDACGVLVYGYSDAVSYMFAGGLDLKQIVIQ